MDVSAASLAARVDEATAKGIAAVISRLVTTGELASGAQLPTVRSLARALSVSPTTVNQAWQSLGKAGVVETRGRNGTYVRADRRAPGPRRYRRMSAGPGELAMDLSLGTPDPDLLPELGPMLARVAARTRPLGYLADPVLPELAELLHERWPFAAGGLTVVDGAMDALDRLTALTVRLGDTVVVEEAAFPPLLDLLDAVGATAVPAAVDDEGIVPSALQSVLHRRPVAVFLQPRAHNPLGVGTTVRRARELARILAPARSWVIEDDHAGDISTNPLVSLGTHLPDRTVLVQSFSKSHGPDLRLAAVGGAVDLVDELESRRLLGAGWSSRLLQGVLVELLTAGETADVLDRARQTYAARRAALTDALDGLGVATTGRDGINLWVEVADERAAAFHLATNGIGVAVGSPFVVGRSARDHVRVTVGLVRDGTEELAKHLALAAAPPAARLRGR